MPHADPSQELFESLSPAQWKIAGLHESDPDRTLAQFPMLPRKGVQIKALNAAQKKLVARMIDQATSPYGAKQIRTVMAMPRGGYENYYLAWYGGVGDAHGYEWRLSGHHLTLNVSHLPDHNRSRVGPLLLGADPPTLWTREEDLAAALYHALSEADKKTALGTKAALPGVLLQTQSPLVRDLCQKLLDERLRVYNKAIIDDARRLLRENGGWNPVRLLVTGDPTKRNADGGRYRWELRGPALAFWGDSTNGHLHMLLDVGPQARVSRAERSG